MKDIFRCLIRNRKMGKTYTIATLKKTVKEIKKKELSCMPVQQKYRTSRAQKYHITRRTLFDQKQREELN